MKLVESIPYYKELVLRWFDARYVTMKTIDQLRLRMSSAYAPRLRIFNASPVMIPFGLVQHLYNFHPVKWDNLGHSLGHNRMPWPRVTVVGDPVHFRIHPGW